jgi:glycosyltransferase involved in cell wall biosynthesis
MANDLTVIMATYRQSEWLIQAMLSVVPQVQYPGELRIIGELSDSETIDVLQDWFNLLFPLSPGRMIYGLNRENEFWKARQRGLSDTKAEYITFFDSDDVMLPGWLEKGMNIAREISSRGKIPIVGPSFRMVDEKLRPMQDVILPEFSMGKMMGGCIIPDASITTTEAIKSVGGLFDPDGYDPHHPYYCYSLWLRILKKYGDKVEVKLLPEIAWLYRQHRKGMHNKFQSKRHSAENVRRAREVARHYFPELGDGSVTDGKEA